MYKSSDINLPSEMENVLQIEVKCMEVFKGFYETRTKHRKLTWIYSLGTGNIDGKFEPKTIELILSTYQAAALLLFNTADRLSYSEIVTQLNLTNEDLVRILHSLAENIGYLLKSRTQELSLQKTALSSTPSLLRIKIPLPRFDERKKVVKDVDKDRRYAIDAALVRIMKSRRRLSQMGLVLECVELLTRLFKLDVRAFRKRIEDLIAREFLERETNNPNMFRALFLATNKLAYSLLT